MNIADLLEKEEGYRGKAYYCSEGYPTIGIGQKIGPKGSNLNHYDFTISKPLAKAWLMDSVIDTELELAKLDWFQSLDLDRRTVIISMAYQIGITGLLKFENMIAAIDRGHWNQAATEALDSRWAKQTPKRAGRHSRVISGELLSEVYK